MRQKKETHLQQKAETAFISMYLDKSKNYYFHKDYINF